MYHELKEEIAQAQVKSEESNDPEEDAWFRETIDQMKSEIDELESKVGMLECVPLRIKLADLSKAQLRFKRNNSSLKAANARYKLAEEIKLSIQEAQARHN